MIYLRLRYCVSSWEEVVLNIRRAMKGKNIQIQTQGQQMLQTQSLSPLQVLVARLLGLTTIEMEERVRGEVIDNPALEASSRDESTEMGGEEEGDYSGTDEELITGEGFEFHYPTTSSTACPRASSSRCFSMPMLPHSMISC